MISLIEHKLIGVFSQLPDITEGGKDYPIQYYFGSKEDRETYLNSVRQKQTTFYPLIWLIPETVTGAKNHKNTTLNLLIAVKGNLEGNIDKMELKYNPSIVPVANNVITALKRSGFTSITDENDITYKIFPNYGANGESEQSDIWDVLKLGIPIQFDDCKIRNINF